LTLQDSDIELSKGRKVETSESKEGLMVSALHLFDGNQLAPLSCGSILASIILTRLGRCSKIADENKTYARIKGIRVALYLQQDNT